MPNNRILFDRDEVSPKLKQYSEQLDADVVMNENIKDFRTFLKYFSHHDECYTQIDLKSMKVNWAYGFKRWLGYPDKNIEGSSYDHMKDLVHPFIASWYTAFLRSMYLVFTENNQLIDLKPRFVINIPVLFGRDRYLLVKQMSMPYGINKKGQVVGFINSYSIFGDYQAEPLTPRIYGEKGEPHTVAMEKMMDHMCSCITDDNTPWYLKPAQIEIVKRARETRKGGLKFSKKTILDKKLQKQSVSGVMVRIKQLLLDMVDKEELVEGNNKHHGLPDSTDYFKLIEYFDLSGILDITILYKKKYIPKR
jgi:hypothetical protein